MLISVVAPHDWVVPLCAKAEQPTLVGHFPFYYPECIPELLVSKIDSGKFEWVVELTDLRDF